MCLCVLFAIYEMVAYGLCFVCAVVFVCLAVFVFRCIVLCLCEVYLNVFVCFVRDSLCDVVCCRCCFCLCGWCVIVCDLWNVCVMCLRLIV